MTQIYGLIDPREPEAVRYVGKTINCLTHRCQVHCSAARQADHRPVSVWIRSLFDENLSPGIVFLEECENGDEAERWWVAALTEQGCDLTNCTAGGGGAPPHQVRVVADVPFDWAAIDREHNERYRANQCEFSEDLAA